MRPLSSSTSSSESGDGGGSAGPSDGAPAPRRNELREALIVGAWALLFLSAADVTVNRLFPLPRDPRQKPTGQLAVYFNYGRSIEAKIRREVGPTDQTSSPLSLAGWIDREIGQFKDRRESAKTTSSLSVSCYGMSFSNHISRAMAGLDPGIQLRLFGGPSAPANHAYATYELDRGGPSKVVMLGVLGSSVPGLATNNGMTWRFEGPAPFTYPRYWPRNAGLRAEWPVVRTLEDLRSRLADPAAWEAYRAQLQATDAFYHDFLFRQTLGDHSTIVRMIRRAVAQRWQSSRIAQIHGPSGFVESSPVIASLRAIVTAFAAGARRDGKLPIVLLIQDRGYRDHVYRALEPVLLRDQIPYLRTDQISPATDIRNFLPDGHFTPEANRKLGQALLELIHRSLPAG